MFIVYIPKSKMWISGKSCRRGCLGEMLRGMQVKLLACLIVALCNLSMSGAQIPPAVQQIQFVPKSYFFQQQSSQLPLSDSISEESSVVTSSTLPGDNTRNPRHLAPDRFYVGPSEVDQSATATTSLRASTLDRAGNPIDFNQDLDQELKLDISNNNPNNNQYEAKILPNSHPQSLTPRRPSKVKGRRNKTRPPKNVIIYSLPEQSFYASGNGESSYSESDSRERDSTGLRSDLGDEPQGEEHEQVADSKEFRASQSGTNVLAQKKALLGQCMAQCIDAIL